MALLLPSPTGAVSADGLRKHAVHSIGDLLRVMMDALRHPNDDVRGVIISPGTGGQNPHEKQLVDLKAPQNGEQALIEAYNAQVQGHLNSYFPYPRMTQ